MSVQLSAHLHGDYDFAHYDNSAALKSLESAKKQLKCLKNIITSVSGPIIRQRIAAGVVNLESRIAKLEAEITKYNQHRFIGKP